MEQGDEEESKAVSKKAAKKEAAKLEKLRRRQEAALASAATALTVEDIEDPLAANYGDVPLSELQSRVESDLSRWTRVGNLNEGLKDTEVLIKGRVHTTRPVGKKMVFVVVRNRGFTVQCVVTVQADLVSNKMVKFAAGLSRESIIEVHGLVSVPSDPIKGTSQQVEVQVRKVYCITKAVPTLPINIDDAARSEKDMEEGLQKVIIPNKHGEKLVGLLHDTGSKEIVVLCHGFRSSKDQGTMKNLAFALENGGISAFRFDFSGNGESEGSFSYADYWREADDLRAVIDHFSVANRVISAVLGHSKGGDVVLLYASKYHDIGAVVNVSGRYDLSKGIEERLGEGFMEKIKEDGFIDVKNKAGYVEKENKENKAGSVVYRLTLEGLTDRLNTDMHKASIEIDKDCRVMTVHGSADEVVPVEDGREFSKIINNHKLQIIEGANHSYTKHQTELASVVLNFIKEFLGNEKDASK